MEKNIAKAAAYYNLQVQKVAELGPVYIVNQDIPQDKDINSMLCKLFKLKMVTLKFYRQTCITLYNFLLYIDSFP